MRVTGMIPNGQLNYVNQSKLLQQTRDQALTKKVKPSVTKKNSI